MKNAARYKVILGQGNPGNEYLWTRHNLGYVAVDALAKKWGEEWKFNEKFGGHMAIVYGPSIGSLFNGNIILLKTLSYYNEIGSGAANVVRFYRACPSRDFLAICDDFNLEFGEMRLRPNGSAGGNNGLKSLISALGTDEFARLRIGTNSEMRRSPEAKISDSDFVLGKLTEDERKKLPEVLKKAVEKVQSWLDSPANGDI